ncbi:MAG TPA: hypothetical protein DGT23_12990, partial [Micromonosporaceae bacterium]|nr:hypothetical protein [Micromonosporaceae bacterium]
GAGGAGGGGNLVKEAADSVCEQFKGFIFGTIEKVFAAIGRFEVKGFTGNLLKDIFIFIRNSGAVLGNLALDTVKFVVVNGIEVALGAVLNGIAAVASIAAVITNIVLILQPWTSDVRPDPLISRRNESANPGTVKLTMRGITGRNNWPTELTGCARAAGITLPSLKPKDADLTWTITNQHPAPMIVKKSDTAVLKDDGTATMQFETLPEPPEVVKDGEEQTDGIALLDIAVHRKDLDQVHKLINDEIFKLLPALVDKTFGGAIRDVIRPQIQKLLQPLETLRDITVKTVIPVNYHTKKDDKTAKPGAPGIGPGGKRGSVPTLCPGVEVITRGSPRPPVNAGGWEFDGAILPEHLIPQGSKTCGYSAWLGAKDPVTGFQQAEQIGLFISSDAETMPANARPVAIPGTDRAWFEGILKVVVDGRTLGIEIRIRTTEDLDATAISVAKVVLGVA